MTKSILLLPALLLIAGCASGPDAADYAGYDCDSLRALVGAQDASAATRGIDVYADRGVDEIRQESGSPWAGSARTRDEAKLIEERGAIRQAYRRKGCKA